MLYADLMDNLWLFDIHLSNREEFSSRTLKKKKKKKQKQGE